ncbi:uncharacterized protein KIAA0825 homolog isoform X3 [Varanus komodoensis]|uniref:uncharacterized protein KIAA0825 homolog isoform X3 n=1 Tax=Varanus komodoensis TaxID=61221 RepID=UPI001CF7CEDB|nr:uncharacterized protein KIAA0825 homolog isoform X3 [Varanus komodoensis]
MEWGGEYSLDSSNLDCLLNILPGDLEFQQIIGDIDEKIKKNTSGMEQCLKELQLEINEMCSDELLQDTADCLQWLNNCSFTSLKPSLTPHGELIEFLQTLQGLMKNEQNQEEIILHFLLDLSSQCGVLFPCTPSGASFEFTSGASLHGIEDDSAMDVQCIWDDIRLHLRRFLVNQLQNHEEAKTGTLQEQLHFKTRCLQQLLFLYPESEVLAKYQNMQNKLVSDLLQKCVLESSGETNFEKMVHGYESSIPAMCAMIKEDLYILSGIIDSPSTLKFINETYLDTITEEMTLLLETLCELQFKENALHGVKASKSLKKHRRLAPVGDVQEYSRKGRNFCLTLHQLRCLSKLINLFLLMEEKVEELSSEMLLLPNFLENKNVQGVLKKAGQGELLIGESKANETGVLPEQLLPLKKSAMLEFGWRNAFRDLSSSVAHCITIVVEDFSSKILQYEQNEQTSATCYVMHLVYVKPMKESWGVIHEREQPKQISKFCNDIMEELDTLLPLALACRDESLQEIRATFVEACCKVATAVLMRLEERSKDVPSRAPLQNLYTILSTAVHICQHFKTYHDLMKEPSGKPLFLMPLQQYQELIRILQFQVTGYCIRVCATSILQDAESHYWEDSKAFYEGERCSFSVQMWHYFCCALHHDLWTVLPPVLAQEILTEVLEETLALFASRYFQAQPSYKRTPQIRIDVAAILMTCEHILWSICLSVQELLHPCKDRNPHIYKIHRHCNNLLTAAVVLTTPLENLYKTFQNDSGDPLPSGVLEPTFYQPLHWLSSITQFSPSLLKVPSAREMAVQGQLKLLLSQPYCNWNLLLETLLHHDCLILKILLRSSKSELPKGEEKHTCQDLKNSTECSLTEAIFTVLSYCTLSPKSLGSVLQYYMEKEQMWACLHNISDSSYGESEPEIIRCLKLTLINSVKGIVKQIISLMHSWEATENYGTYQHKQIVPESLLKTVPKEWNYTPREMKRKESGKCFTRLAAHAISIVISKLPAVIACLPAPIKYFFFLSEKKMHKNFIESKKAGLLVWILIVIICRIFEDGNTTELLTGTTLDRWSKEKLSLVRVCLESIIERKKSPKQVTHKIIQSIEQQRPNWIESQLLKARKLSIDSSVTATEDGRSLEEEAIELELTEQKINMMVLDICHKPGGSEYLRQIYHIIQLNEEYLTEQLSYDGSSEENIKPLNMTLRTKGGRSGFDPLHMHYLYCTNVLEKFTVAEWKWDWSNLLPSYLGLNKMTLRALLAHRWEMKEEETVEEKEKEMLEHLKKLYLMPTSPASEVEQRT